MKREGTFMTSNTMVSETVLPLQSSAFEIDTDVYKTLLESTKAIPWKLDWATKRFAYIGPQIEEVLGWPQESWVTLEDWTSRIHPDERERVSMDSFDRILKGLDHEKDYRALSIDNYFVWVRDVVHVVRNADDEIESLIGFKFDISEQKRIEQEHARMQRKLERFSYEDGLTKASNRRHFDLRLEDEWLRGKSSGAPLSLILLDVDHFKQLNDRDGHLRGDQCLIQIASTLKQLVAQSENLVARFGGEEFAILMPDTDSPAAVDFAELCRTAIEQLSYRDNGGGRDGSITASFGVGTIVPSEGSSPLKFCEAVDQQLYKAKNEGRNCVRAVTFHDRAFAAMAA
jgi:diguanylate cyclase (GGDEF)-like protein/PAS domain S-box-containing protein